MAGGEGLDPVVGPVDPQKGHPRPIGPRDRVRRERRHLSEQAPQTRAPTDQTGKVGQTRRQGQGVIIMGT